jgi:hypothetical protein
MPRNAITTARVLHHPEMTDCFREQIERIADTLGTEYGTAYSVYTYFAASDEMQHRNRIQACRTFPILMAAFCGAVPLDGLDEIKGAIDHGRQLIPAIARCFDVRPHTVRFVVGKEVELLGSRWQDSIPQLLESLEAICPEHRPKTVEDWELFSSLIDSLERLELEGIRRAWLKQFAATGYRAARDRIVARHGSWGAMDSIHDFAHQWVQHVFDTVKPEPLQGMALQTLLDAELARIGLFRALELSDKWHVELRRLQATTKPPRLQRGLTWAPLAGPCCFDGLSVVPLTTHHDLYCEGVMLEHCVAGYLENCLAAISHIFSIRTAENEALSTLEISAGIDNKGAPRLRLVQHSAHRNATPNKCCQDVARKFMKFLKQTVTTEHIAQLETDALARRGSPEPSQCAIQWQERLNKQALLTSYGEQNFKRLVGLARNVA